MAAVHKAKVTTVAAKAVCGKQEASRAQCPFAACRRTIWLRERIVSRACANGFLAASALRYCMEFRMFVSPRSQMLRPPFRDRCFQFQLLS